MILGIEATRGFADRILALNRFEQRTGWDVDRIIMKIRYERPVSHSASWSRRLGLFALVLLIVATIMHRFDSLGPDTLAAVMVLSGLIAALAAILGIVGLIRLWMVGAKGGKASAWGLAFSILVLVPVGFAVFRVYSLPPLHDISTDTANAPDFLNDIDGRLVTVPFMIAAAEPYAGQQEAYPQVTGRRYEGAVDRVLEAVYLVSENKGIRITDSRIPERASEVSETDDAAEAPDTEELATDDGVEDAVADAPESTQQDSASEGETTSDEGLADGEVSELAEGLVTDGDGEDQVLLPAAPPPVVITLQGETKSLMLGFESDISIRLSEEAETTFVDMRAVSRFAPHDMGINAALISEFLSELDAQLLGISVR